MQNKEEGIAELQRWKDEDRVVAVFSLQPHDPRIMGHGRILEVRKSVTQIGGNGFSIQIDLESADLDWKSIGESYGWLRIRTTEYDFVVFPLKVRENSPA
jgi:hypothetical protein